MRKIKKYRLPSSFKNKKELKKSGVHRRRNGKIYLIEFKGDEKSTDIDHINSNFAASGF